MYCTVIGCVLPTVRLSHEISVRDRYSNPTGFFQLQTVQLELARSQQRMEHAELERDVYQQNYQSLCTQVSISVPHSLLMI